MASPVVLGAADRRWLAALLAVPSVSPLEGGDPAAAAEAQRVVAEGATARGFELQYRGAPPAAVLARADVPGQVREAAAAVPGFLAGQPSLVLRMGRPQPAARRIVINFHIDTVGPHLPPRWEGRRLHGRGAIDDKGPGVAAAVGVAAAWAVAPWLADTVEVRLASVPGEEGGAMGTYGTRWLVETGCVGRLNLFAEPTGGRVLDACSAAMTPRLRVVGEDATDDHPGAGHNATVALGYLAAYLARELGPRAAALGAKVCVAGLRTGASHNRVYGSGELRINIAYFDPAAAAALEADLPRLITAAGERFAVEFAGNPLTDRLVRDWERVVRLDWLKRGLPPLANRDPAMEELLGAAGLPRHDGIADGTAFTCDAIWAAGPDRYVAVCGPGRLDTNGAHTPDEYVDLDDLDDYATKIRDLVLRFGARAAHEPELCDQPEPREQEVAP